MTGYVAAVGAVADPGLAHPCRGGHLRRKIEARQIDAHQPVTGVSNR